MSPSERPSVPEQGPPASRRPIREAITIVIVGTLLGVVANAISPRGIPFVGDFSRGAALANRTAEELAELPDEVDLAGVVAALAEDAEFEALLLDARDPGTYEAGHIPGAVNLPLDEFETFYADLEERIEASPLTIVYCDGGDCELSHDLATMLKELGHDRLQLFPEGFDAWMEAGHEITAGSDP